MDVWPPYAHTHASIPHTYMYSYTYATQGGKKTKSNENTMTNGGESSHLTEILHGISTVLHLHEGSSDLDMKSGDYYLMTPSN